MILDFLFWLSFLMIVYAYGGYTMLLQVIAWLKHAGDRHAISVFPVEDLPKISLLISAYNEEAVIEAKILNALALNYPSSLLEIVVISDGSTDTTNDIVKRYRDRNVVLRSFTGRIGKTACLNRVVPDSTGRIIVFSDANSEYHPDVLREIVKVFFDRRIGFVTGWTKYTTSTADGVASLGLYAKLELLTKKYESFLGSCVGADGAIFAIRKELYRPLRDNDINDFVIPLGVIRQGFQGVLAEKVFCSERSAGSLEGEFRRQVRITNRTIRAIFRNAALLNPIRYGVFSFALFSHKICRFLVPFFLACLFISNVLLLNSGVVYRISCVLQVTFYCAAGIGSRVSGSSFPSRSFAAVRDFVMVNLAICVAWVKYMQGTTYTTWSPTSR